MKNYEIICSVDAVNVDYEQRIDEETAASCWACQNIAEEHGYSFWYVNEWTE